MTTPIHDPKGQVAGAPPKRITSGLIRLGKAWWLAILLLLATAAVLFWPAIVRAVRAQFGCSDAGDTVLISGYTGVDGQAIIPGTFNGLPITSIGNGGPQDLTSVTIDDSITNIGDWALANIPTLTSVTIPDSIIAIGYGAFTSCSGLTAINVDARNPAYSSVDGVLFNKRQTTLIVCPAGKAGAYTVPAGVTNIADWAFELCASLTSVTIPQSVTSIGKCAFFSCNGLTNVTMGSNVAIGADAFLSCNKLPKAQSLRQRQPERHVVTAHQPSVQPQPDR